MDVGLRHIASAGVFALGLHGAVAVAVFWSPPEGGAAGAGEGGLEIALGSAGGAPGTLAPTLPELVRPVAPAQAEAEPADLSPVAAVEPPVIATDAVAAVVVRPDPPMLSERSAEPPVRAPEAVELSRAEPMKPAVAQATDAALSVVEPAIEKGEAVTASGPEARSVPMPRARPETVPPRQKRRVARKPEPIQRVPAKSAPAQLEPDPEPDPIRQAARPEGDAAKVSSDNQGQGEDGASGEGTASGTSDQAHAGGDPGARRDYISRLAANLSRHKRYPRRARARGQEGTGRLFFVVEQSGQVSAIQLRKSAGHRLLDDEILAILGRVGSFPPIPDAVGVARLEIVVPINFDLR